MDKLDIARGIKEYGDSADAAIIVQEYAKPLAEAVLAEAEIPMRYALVSADASRGETLKSYMPGNFEVLGRTPIQGTNTVQWLIGGRDSHGWTLDGYVLPRLASGMYYGVEIGA